MVNVNHYEPNTNVWPISFRSLTSAQDCIFNVLLDHIKSGYGDISTHVINELQSLKFVKSAFGEFNTNTYFNEMDNNYQHNPEQYLRKSVFKYLSYRLFYPGIALTYENLTDLDNRQLATNQYYRDEYYIDLKSNSIINPYEVTRVAANLGITYQYDGSCVMTVQKVEDLNLLRLSSYEVQHAKTHHSKELFDLECNIAHQFPIKLNIGTMYQ
jgi:hypothetical protein